MHKAKTNKQLRYAWLLAVAGCTVVASPPITAQSTTGSIFGTVSDQTGSVIPNAKVTATNTQTGISIAVQSNGSGNYTFPALGPGDYTVTTTAAGFSAETQKNVHLDANANVNTAFALQAGAADQTITVSAETTLVDTRESQLGETIDQKRIQDLPLNGRDPYALVQLVPGVTAYGAQAPTGDQFGTTFSVNGSRTVDNTEYLDGAFDSSVYTGGGNLLPNPDALQEFRILTSNFDAEYGRFPGAVLNAIVRSGTNAIHGQVHEYNRNSALTAKSYFNSSVTPLNQNQFGAGVGGPILRNKAFFFLSYEGLRIATPDILAGAAVPTLTAAEAGGNFSALPTAQQPMLNGAPYSCNGVQGVICPNLLDPVAQNLLKYVPLEDPTTGVAPQQSASANTTDNQGVGRIDYQLNQNQQLSGTFFQSRGTNINPTRGNPNQILDYSAAANYDDVTNIAINHVWTISSNKLNTLRPFYTLNHFDETNALNSNVTWSSLGSQTAVAATPLTPPQIVIDGYWSMGMGASGPDNIHQQVFGLEDTFNWTLGNHTVKLGGAYLYNTLHEFGEYLGTGEATFNGSITGNALADFLLGHASSFRQNNGASHALHLTDPSLFAQDDWRITHKLTLDLGVRWEIFGPFVGQNNLGTFEPGVQSTRFPDAPLGLLTSGDPGVPDGILHTGYKDFAPRVGFAYDVFGNGKTAIRGGFGLFYASRSVSQVTNPEQQPFIRDITISDTPNLVNPYGPGADPFPYAVNLQNPSFISPLTVSGIPPGTGFPHVGEYNLTLEQQLAANLGFRLQYVGSSSRKLYITSDINEPAYVPGASTSTNGLNARRPYEPAGSPIAFGSIVEEGEANANYNSLQATITRPFSHGFSLLASYVWSKSMDISSSEPANITLTLSNQLNPKADWARSDFDVPNRFIASYVWAPPNTRRLGFIGRHVLSNWQLNGITTLSSGSPFTITSGVDSNLDGINTDRPNEVANPFLSEGRPLGQKVKEFFNTAAFAQVPAGVPFGNVSRNSLLGPKFIDTDFSAFKNFRVWGERTLQFRAETFNIFNNVNLATPNATLSSPQFGTIGGLAGNAAPRILQLAVRYQF